MIDSDSSQLPIAVSSKRFSMGVTALQSDVYEEYIFCVGSYNEQGFVLDVRVAVSLLNIYQVYFSVFI